jgi:hypothetical protein
MEERIVESFIHIIEGFLGTIITLCLSDLWKELKNIHEQVYKVYGFVYQIGIMNEEDIVSAKLFLRYSRF